MSIYTGIDPGKSVGIAVIDTNVGKVFAFKMANTEADIKNILKAYAIPGIAIIEAVHAFPGQGVTSMFTFGQNYGFLRGCLVALGISFIEVTPQKWMAYFGLKKDKEEAGTDYKKRILQKAQNLFPNSNVTLQTADSLMLCEYLKQTNRS